MTTLTRDDLDRMTNDDRWQGFGYLGERRNRLESTDPEAPATPETVAIVDEHVLEVANTAGLTYDDLFAWANSKDGRWFGDCTFGAAVTGHAVRTTFATADRYGPKSYPGRQSTRYGAQA